VVTASGFHDQTDDGATQRIEQSGLNQPVIDRRVEQLIVDHIVHVTIDVVVGPPGLQAPEDPEIGAGRWRCSGHLRAFIMPGDQVQEARRRHDPCQGCPVGGVENGRP
jgi:hypothetical protein